MEVKPDVLVSASAVGYYGDRGNDALDESASAGSGFLSGVCTAWEQEARAAENFGIRVVCVRIGIILAAGGGALARMLPVFKLAAGGHLGRGTQWMPWIHLDDVVGILLAAARNKDLKGAINAVSPHPVTNAEFTRALAQAVGRPAVFPVPKTALRIAFGEMSDVLLASQRCLPRRAQQCGYVFAHPDLPEALDAILGDSQASD